MGSSDVDEDNFAVADAGKKRNQSKARQRHRRKRGDGGAQAQTGVVRKSVGSRPPRHLTGRVSSEHFY
jgi:hypothetical protein